MDWQSQSDEDMRATDYMLLQNRESVQGVIVIVFDLSLTCESITTVSTPPPLPLGQTPGICFTMSPGGRAFDS